VSSLGRRKMAPPRWTTVTMLLMGFVLSTSLAQDMTREEQEVSLSGKQLTNLLLLGGIAMRMIRCGLLLHRFVCLLALSPAERMSRLRCYLGCGVMRARETTFKWGQKPLVGKGSLQWTNTSWSMDEFNPRALRSINPSIYRKWKCSE